jgi:hypothetical protein
VEREEVVKKLIVVALAGVATLAVPIVGAEAKPPWGAGEKAAGKGGAKSKRCEKPRAVGFVAAGTLASVEGSSVNLTVARANRHARRWLESNEAAFDTANLTVSFAGVTDGDLSGTVDLADVLPADRVRVLGKLALPKRGCGGEAVLTLRKVKVLREVATETEADTTG